MLLSLLALALGVSACPPPSKKDVQADYVNQAVEGINQMQSWYDGATGIWGNAWWNSANALTTLADFETRFPHVVNWTGDVYSTTLARAPTALGYTGFINDYYDDELWWALAWIQVYDVTGDRKYLDVASSIFEDARVAWGTTPCAGGLWWDKARSYVNAIANELYLATAAKLANRKPEVPAYWDEAVRAHDWFLRSGMINPENLVNDGLTHECTNNGNDPFTYNVGVIIGGLTEMALVSNDTSYNDLANTLAIAGIDHFTDKDGILREPCEPNYCSVDQQQFKGVLARNVEFMVNEASSMPEDARTKYIQFLQTNANALLAGKSNEFGLVWGLAVPAQLPATIQTQSSALDMIVAAAAVS